MSYQAYQMPPPMPVDPTAVAGKRIGAWFIDGVIVVVIAFLIMSLTGYGPNLNQVSADTVQGWATNQGLPVATEQDQQTAGQRYCEEVLGFDSSGTDGTDRVCTPVPGEGVAVLSDVAQFYILLGILAVVFIIYQGLLGASLGKLAMGLRIVKPDGSKAGIGASAVRTLLWVVDAITCGLPIVGGILILSTKGHRRVGDMAAGTYVVPHTQVGHPVILPGQAGWGGYQTGPYPGPTGGIGGPGGAIGGPPSGPPAIPGRPTPWAPTSSGPSPTPPFDSTTEGPNRSSTSGDYEADVPIWDDERHAYIQYDSDRSAWLEFDDTTQNWKPIST